MHNPAILKEDVTWAKTLVRALQERMLAMAEEYATDGNQLAQATTKMRNLIKARGTDGMTRSEALRKFGGSASDWDKIERTLAERGEIRIAEQGIGRNGKQTVKYYYISRNKRRNRA